MLEFGFAKRKYTERGNNLCHMEYEIVGSNNNENYRILKLKIKQSLKLKILLTKQSVRKAKLICQMKSKKQGQMIRCKFQTSRNE